jgi:hypothetical protein
MKWLRFTVVLLPVAGLALALPSAGGGEKKKYETFGKIVRLDPRLDKILPTDSKLEKLDGGFLPGTKDYKFVWTEVHFPSRLSRQGSHDRQGRR